MDRQQAEEHLRVIRSLMEKATIYRAISAPTALVGGLLALGTGVFFAVGSDGIENPPLVFLALWTVVLALTAAANVMFLRKDAKRRGERFVSAGMKLALRSLLPAYFVAATLTTIVTAHALHGTDATAALPFVWAICHGVGLLSTAHF